MAIYVRQPDGTYKELWEEIKSKLETEGAKNARYEDLV